MNNRYHISRRRISSGLLAGFALIALGGCYPYYYDFHYDHRDGYHQRGHHGKKHYYDGGRYHHRDRYERERRKRHRHYRGYW